MTDDHNPDTPGPTPTYKGYTLWPHALGSAGIWEAHYVVTRRSHSGEHEPVLQGSVSDKTFTDADEAMAEAEAMARNAADSHERSTDISANARIGTGAHKVPL